MSKNKVYNVFLLFIAAINIVGLFVSCNKSSSSGQPRSSTSVIPVPKVTASLSNFTIDRENAQFVFTVQVINIDPKENTVYAVVYGKNDMFIPPRRSAWPVAGMLFQQAGTARGALSPSDISKNWQSRPQETRGAKFVLDPKGTHSIEGALPINKTCQHDTWRGKPLDPRSMFNEVFLWVYSHDGSLIFEKKYNLQ